MLLLCKSLVVAAVVAVERFFGTGKLVEVVLRLLGGGA